MSLPPTKRPVYFPHIQRNMLYRASVSHMSGLCLLDIGNTPNTGLVSVSFQSTVYSLV